MGQRGFSFLLILVVVLIVGLVGVLAYILLSNLPTAPKSNPFPHSTKEASSSASPIIKEASGSGKLYLYTASGDNLTQITEFDNFVTNSSVPIDSPVLGSNQSIFFHDATTLYQYKMDTKVKSTLMTTDLDYSFDLINFQQPDLLFVTEVPNNYYGNINPPYFIEINTTTNKERRIAFSNRLMFGNLEYLFKNAAGEDLVGSFAKKDCGDIGKIYDNHFGNSQLIFATGGCDRKPIYVGSDVKKDQLVFLSYPDPSPPPNGIGSPIPILGYDKFYAQDFKSQSKLLLQLDGPKRQISSFVYNPDQNKIAIFYLDSMYILDVDSATLSNKLPLNQNQNSFYAWRGDYGIGYFTDQRKMWLVKLPEASVKQYQLPSQFSANASPQIIGNWNGGALVSIFQPN